MKRCCIENWIKSLAVTATAIIAMLLPSQTWARDIDYEEQEITVRVAPSEPTQIRFPGIVSGGYMKKFSSISIEKKESDLIVFANDKIDEAGEAIVVRLTDGRSYSIRMQRASADIPRDDIIHIRDKRGSIIDSNEEELPAYKQKKYDDAPATAISGFMRELVLSAEFNKPKISGYQVSDQYRGEMVLNDGTVKATIDRIFIGPNLWGYVVNVENLLDQTQKLNPATFRLDGTRAISLQRSELAPRPIDVEQQIAGHEKAKVYIITKAR